MIFKSILIVLMVTIGHDLFSQAEINGRIIDSMDARPVDFAVISLYKKGDTIMINGGITDSTGRFVIHDLKEGIYHLRIDAAGYVSKTLQSVSLDKNAIKDLGAIGIAGSGVIITGRRTDNQNRIDKQVYKAAQFDAANGGTAIDVLKNTPSVTVNAEGEIRLRGLTGFLVLINGKPVVTDITTVLSQLPANAIENIEVITSPSAQYDADGKSGIINITTRKGVDNGWSFTVNTQYGLPSVNYYNNLEKPKRYGADGYLNYKKDKWEFSAGASYQENDIAGWREGNVNTTLDNRYTSFPSTGERSFKRRNYSARATITYIPDKKNSVTAGFYIGQRRQFRRADIFYDNIKTDVVTGQSLGRISYFNSNLVKKQGDFSLVSLDYNHAFGNKSVLSLSGLYEYALLDGFTKNLNSTIAERTDTLDYVLNTGRSPLTGIRAKADYEIPIGKGKLVSGYQLRYQKQTGLFLYQNAVLGSNMYVVVPEFSDDIEVINNIQGIYSQYSGKQGKLEYLAGLRYEYSSRTFSASKVSQPYRLNISNLFPSMNLLYTWKPGVKTKAGYSRRVQRSTSNELNPYPEREHSETLEQGDPRIRPEFVNLAEAGFIRDFKKNGSVFVTLYNQRIDNVVNRVNSVYNDSILNRIYTNAVKATLWGIESGINFKPQRWWTFYLGGNMYDYRIHGALFDNSVRVNNSGWVYSLNVNQAFQLLKTLSVQFNLNYLSKRPTAQGEDSRFISPNISVKKTFMDGKLSAIFQWQNAGLGIIPSNEQRITTWGNNFFTTTNYIQEKDVFWINLGYNFKQSNKKLKLPSSEFGEREF